MSYFLCNDPLEVGEAGTLTDAEAHHALHARRIRTGEHIEVQDGHERRFQALVTKMGKHTIQFVAEKALPTPPEPKHLLTLCMALTAHQTLDVIAQKATELGVHALVLFPADHSPNSRAAAKTDRWHKIAVEAAKQCGRSKPTTILLAPSLADTVTLPAGARFYATQHATAPLLLPSPLPDSASLWIGPEGGYSEREIQMFTEARITPVRLPGFVLRSETAALAGITLLQAKLNP